MPFSDLQKCAQATAREVNLGAPIRQACDKWQANRSYVRRRLEGIPTREETNAEAQALSVNLEQKLAFWAIGQARLGFAPALVKFRSMAQRMLAASGSSHQLGKNCHMCFLNRNPPIRSTRASIIDYSRVNGATAKNIRIFFARLGAPEIQTLTADRFYNADEIGFGQGVGQDHQVIGDASVNITFKKDVEKGEWITVVKCISGSGNTLSPLVIFKGKEIQQQWFPDKNRGFWEDWRFRASDEGWTSNKIGCLWLEDIFIPHIRALHSNRWVVLVCDGHDSHTNDDFLWLCLTNKIWLVHYEPHCSHVLQPLDVCLFALVKKRLKTYLRECRACS